MARVFTVLLIWIHLACSVRAFVVGGTKSFALTSRTGACSSRRMHSLLCSCRLSSKQAPSRRNDRSALGSRRQFCICPQRARPGPGIVATQMSALGPEAGGRPVAVVTGASRGLGLEISRRLLERNFSVVLGIRGVSDDEDDDTAGRGENTASNVRKALQQQGFTEPSDFLVVSLDVRSIKSISAAATKIGDHFPQGIDLLINNAAISPDGYDYDVVQETLDVNFFGSLNMIRRLVPARWPEAVTGNWLPAQSGFMGMRARGLILNLVCRQASALLGPPVDLDRQFASATKETELVMRLTSYLGQVSLGVPLEDEWPNDMYYTSKVALEHLTRIVAASVAEQAGRRYEPDLQCLAVDPGWLRTQLGGQGAPLSVQEGAEEVMWVLDNRCSIPSGAVVQNRKVNR